MKIVLILSLVFLRGEALIGYDCSGGFINRTMLSLLDVKSCEEDYSPPVVKPVMVALTQTAGTSTTVAMSCSVKASHIVSRCGKTIDQVYGSGRYTEVMEITRDQCSRILSRNSYQSPHNGVIIDGPRGVRRYYQSLVTSGFVEQDASCTPGTPFFANGAYFDRPLRTTEYEIYGNRIKMIIDYEEKKVILPNGVRCDYMATQCDAGELGYVFWNIESPQCADSGIPKEIVYKGPARLVTVKEGGVEHQYILANHSGSLFQILVDKKREVEICGFLSHPTEHPRLFFTDLTSGYSAFPSIAQLGNSNVDLSLYMNSKLLYVTRNIIDQVERLFREFRSNRCVADTKSAMGWLTVATVSPREFAYQYMGMPGYTAVTTGEVVHIAKCKAVEVIPTPSKGKCYEELQVTWNSTQWFLSPRSRILMRVGTEIHCTPGMHPAFKIMGGWYTPGEHGLVEVPSPNVMTVDVQDYKFSPMVGLAEGGIYSTEALEKVQKMFLAPLEQEAVISRVTTALTGDANLPDGYRTTNMFKPEDYSVINDNSSIFSQIWTPLSWATGPVFVIFLAFKAVKIILNWVIDSRVLLSHFGLWTAILCGCCTSIAHHLVTDEIRVPYVKRKNKGDPKPDDSEMITIYPDLRYTKE